MLLKWSFVVPFVLFLSIFIFFGCEQKPENLMQPKEVIGFDDVQGENPLEYLNHIRIMSGMVSFKYNNILEKAARNHAKYSVFHKYQGHDESVGKGLFTGADPTNRAFYAGYNSQATENISYNKPMLESIDSLFSAIYHRFGFLSFDRDEIGFALEGDDDFKAAVFNMGNSNLERICQNGGDKGYGRFFTHICKQDTFKISQKNYEYAIDFANSKSIVFPYDKSDNVLFYFSGEIPDPLPECKITANPLSVQFSPKSQKVKMLSFRVYENGEELKNIKVITKENDVNKRFSEFEFALFPRHVYKFNTEYKGVFEYIQGGVRKQKEWTFKTGTPKNPYFIIHGGESLSLEADKTYDIFFMPQNCNDVLTTYNVNYPSYAKVKIFQNSVNLFSLRFSGYEGDKAVLKADNGKKINLYLTSTSIEYKRGYKKHFIIGGLILLLAIFVGIFKRK